MRLHTTGPTNASTNLNGAQQTEAPHHGAQTTAGPGRLVWPDAVAFREAVQNPGVALGDPELKNAEVVLDKRGLPVAYSGKFAVVFRLRARNGEEWALRCFTQGTGEEERRLRYTAMQRHVAGLPHNFVPFRYVEQGIRVGFQWYPVVALRWARGETLGRWVEKHLYDPQALKTLCLALSDLLARLEASGIAHGDWQHDNLLVSDNGRTVTLVDYDGMFVPELAGRLSPEIGHPNYQHPFRAAEHFGVGVDRFSHLVLQTALLALCKDPTLWNRFSGDGESFLFKKADFLSPSRSVVFRTIASLCGPGDVLLREALAKLERACVAGQAGVIVENGDGAASAATLAAALGDFHPAATVTTYAPPSSRTNFGPPGKWWMDQNAAPAGAAHSSGAGTVLAAGGGVLLGQMTAPAQTHALHEANLAAGAGFVSRLGAPEILDGERKNLLWTRAAWAVCLALFAFFYLVEQRLSTFPWIILFQLVFLPYNAWPRKKVSDELKAEINKMEGLLSDRYVSLAEKKKGALLPSGQMATDATHYVQLRLSQAPVRDVTLIPGIGPSTVDRLRAAGVQSAADLQHRTVVPGVSVHELSALQNWVREQEMLAADEYRRTAPSQKQISADVTRLEHEIAGFEAELEKLRLEQENFPDVSPATFFRRVVGVK